MKKIILYIALTILWWFGLWLFLAPGKANAQEVIATINYLPDSLDWYTQTAGMFGSVYQYVWTNRSWEYKIKLANWWNHIPFYNGRSDYYVAQCDTPIFDWSCTYISESGVWWDMYLIEYLYDYSLTSIYNRDETYIFTAINWKHTFLILSMNRQSPTWQRFATSSLNPFNSQWLSWTSEWLAYRIEFLSWSSPLVPPEPPSSACSAIDNLYSLEMWRLRLGHTDCVNQFIQQYPTSYSTSTWFMLYMDYRGDPSDTWARVDLYNYYLDWWYIDIWLPLCDTQVNRMQIITTKYWLDNYIYWATMLRDQDDLVLSCDLIDIDHSEVNTGWIAYPVPPPVNQLHIPGSLSWYNLTQFIDWRGVAQCFDYLNIFNNTPTASTVQELANCVITSFTPNLSSWGYPFSDYLPAVPACVQRPNNRLGNTIFTFFWFVIIYKLYFMFNLFNMAKPHSPPESFMNPNV